MLVTAKLVEKWSHICNHTQSHVKESQCGEPIFKGDTNSRFGTPIGRVYPRWYVEQGLAGRLRFRMATSTMPTVAPLAIVQEVLTTYFLPDGTITPESRF